MGTYSDYPKTGEEEDYNSVNDFPGDNMLEE